MITSAVGATGPKNSCIVFEPRPCFAGTSCRRSPKKRYVGFQQEFRTKRDTFKHFEFLYITLSYLGDENAFLHRSGVLRLVSKCRQNVLIMAKRSRKYKFLSRFIRTSSRLHSSVVKFTRCFRALLLTSRASPTRTTNNVRRARCHD